MEQLIKIFVNFTKLGSSQFEEKNIQTPGQKSIL